MQYEGNRFVFVATKEKVINFRCWVQTCSLHHITHLKPPPSFGFRELQAQVHPRREKNSRCITTTVMVRLLQFFFSFFFFESCEFSIIASERLEPGYAWEYISMKEPGFYIAKRGNERITSFFFSFFFLCHLCKKKCLIFGFPYS